MHLYIHAYRFSHNYQKVENTQIPMNGYVTKICIGMPLWLQCEMSITGLCIQMCCYGLNMKCPSRARVYRHAIIV